MYDYANYEGFADPSLDRSVLLDTRGRLRTQNLFIEMFDPREKSRYTPLYCLSDRERKGPDGRPMISAYQVYMASVDEYAAAIKLVGSLRHWRKLTTCKWFVEGEKIKSFEGLNQWREDMAARDSLTAKQALITRTRTGDTGAARALLDLSNKNKGGINGPGRPSVKNRIAEKERAKAEEERQAKIAAALRAQENG